MFAKTILGLYLVNLVNSARATYEITIVTNSDRGVAIVNSSPYVVTLDNFTLTNFTLTIGCAKKPIKLLPGKSINVGYMYQCRASNNYGALGYTIEPEPEIRFGMLEPVKVIRIYAMPN